MSDLAAVAPLPAWPAPVGAALLAALAYGVLVPALRRVRSSDRWVAGGWTTGMALAVGGGWFSALLVLLGPLSGLPHPGVDSAWAARAWLAGVGGTAGLLLAHRLTRRHPAGLALQAVALALAVGLPLLLLLQGVGLAWPAAAPLAGAGTAVLAVLSLPALILAEPAGDANARRRQWHQWASAGLFGVALSAGLVLPAALLPALRDLPPLQPGPAADLLPMAMLPWLSASGTLTLLVGVIVGWVDWRGRAHSDRLSRSLGEANRRLREQAMLDPLTQLPNRLHFEQRLKALAQQPDGPAMAVLFVDLDGFKAVNDSFGHPMGDTVLKAMAERLRAAVAPGDLVARVGGDEFLVLHRLDAGRLGVAQLAQRLLKAVGASLTLSNSVEVKLSCSIGVVRFPDFGPPARLLACADAAMYAAKREGGSTFAFFEPHMEHDARHELTLQGELREALQRQELVLYYQPKIDARSGLITGVEALVRWHHPTLGLVMPGQFIPVAERFGLIGQLGDWVIEESCRQLAAWRAQGLRMRAAINMSAHQLRQDSLLPRLRAAMLRHEIEPSQLTIEIIESVLMDDAAVRSFSGLASLGVGLSIDDFGIGYCNFALLRKLPVKQLKVDRSLFADIQNSADARSVVTAIVHMAHALNLRVVAEGVETEQQRDTLRALEFDELQGFLFARPMAADRLTLWAMEDQTPAVAGGFRPSLFMDDPQEPAAQR